MIKLQNVCILIPSISSNYADTIIEKYPSLIDLVTELNKLSKEERFTTIKNLEYKKGEKKRKLGKKVAENINEYMFN